MLQEKLVDREILVSARTESGITEKQTSRYFLSGVGLIKKTPDVVYREIQRFEILPQVSSHFQEVKYDPKLKRLLILAQALGYQAKLIFQLEFDEKKNRIQFHVIEGPFKGLYGVLDIRPFTVKKRAEKGQASRMSEISIRIAHETARLPIPKSLIGFALEVVAKDVAFKMRRHLEMISSF